MSSLPARPGKLWKVSQANRSGPAWTMGVRNTKINNKNDTPAANAYSIPSKKSKRGGKIGKRFDNKNADELLPGPAKYNISDSYKCVKHTTPQYSIKAKRKDGGEPLGHEIPGPSKYYPSANTKYKKQPKYSFSARNSDDRKSSTPGPAAYSLPNTRSASKITMKGRWKKKQKSNTPGPNHYNPERGARPQSARSCSISARNFMPDKGQDSPGPALYNPSRNMGYQPEP